MEKKVRGLRHLMVTVFLSGMGNFIVIPGITDVTMFALCPATDECSLAIYLSAFQQAVRSLLLLLLNKITTPKSLYRKIIITGSSSYVLNTIPQLALLVWFWYWNPCKATTCSFKIKILKPFFPFSPSQLVDF